MYPVLLLGIYRSTHLLFFFLLHSPPHSLFLTDQYITIEMKPYYPQSNISTPPPTPTIREGNTFPPLRSPLPGHNHIINREYEEGGRGAFDEDDIEIQLSPHSRSSSNVEIRLRVLQYLTIVFLGLIVIGTSIHISNVLYQTYAPLPIIIIS